MAQLFEPLQIRDITLKNRIVVSPMCEYSSVDGYANDWHLVHLGSRAVGGAALVFTEAAAISPEGRISPDDLGIWHPGHVGFLKRITSFIESQGAVAGIQLAHAGRKASHHSPWKSGKFLSEQEGAWLTMAPSAIPYKAGEPLPKAMDITDIQTVIQDFVNSAEFALAAGFKIVEIHAAHGYLLHSFLSPLSNQRTDDYGGTFENRVKILLEVVNAVRAVWPLNLPLFVRISATDWVPGGWTPEDSVELAKKLLAAAVDLVDCSSGGNSPLQQIPVSPLYQVPFAEQIKTGTGILTGAVGLITNANQADAILSSGRADLIFFARQLLRDPYFALHTAKELEIDIDWPVQYQRAKL
jgi:2,4-dienoyl-CoA reductase-like NADH-dependent reductase (Old Yellow Enzyme family)